MIHIIRQEIIESASFNLNNVILELGIWIIESWNWKAESWNNWFGNLNKKVSRIFIFSVITFNTWNDCVFQFK